MGSWYWISVFERFFQRFEKNVYDYFKVEKLDPGFQIIFENKEELKGYQIGMKFLCYLKKLKRVVQYN